MKYGILFDLDGTLIDSTEAIVACFLHTLRRYGYPAPPLEAITALIGYPLDYMFAQLGVKEIEASVQCYKECYRAISKQKTRLLPHAMQAIKEAATFAKLAIVTTKTGIYSRELLEHFEVLDYFEVVIGREDVERPKPDPEPIEKGLRYLVTEREKTWMIGDTPLDMQAAHAAGIKGAAVLCGYGKKEELERCADIVEKEALAAVRRIKNTLRG